MADQKLNTIPDDVQERWLPVEGFAGYEVSDLGRVRSYHRQLSEGEATQYRKWEIATTPQKILRPVKSAGYPKVALCRDGEIYTARVHVLVLLAFVGPCPPGLECCHNDGIPAHNWLDNLRYDTRTGNMLDSVRHGTHPGFCNKGTRNHLAKLTEADVIRIRELYAQGAHTHKMLADQFGVATTAIIGIVKGEYWKHLPSPVMDYAKIAESHRSAPPKHFGAKHPQAKLTDEKVLTIRQFHFQGQSLAALGRVFGVTKQVIFSIVHRKTWRHLKAEKPNQMP
jgi:hypothetical protein